MQIDDKSLSKKEIDGRKEKWANEKDGKVVKEGTKEKLLSSYKATILVNSLRVISSQCYGSAGRIS